PVNLGIQADPTRFLPGASPDARSNGNAAWSNYFTSYGPGSGVSLTSLTGDVTAPTVSVNSIPGLFVHNAGGVQIGGQADPATVGLLL
ncbi:hypothetical protein ABTF92_19675, partial [Acinetobacter baumannii]